jgi:hypothetical protein
MMLLPRTSEELFDLKNSRMTMNNIINGNGYSQTSTSYNYNSTTPQLAGDKRKNYEIQISCKNNNFGSYGMAYKK